MLFMQTDAVTGPPFHCDIDAMRRLFAAPGWAWPDALPGPDRAPVRLVGAAGSSATGLIPGLGQGVAVWAEKSPLLTDC